MKLRMILSLVLVCMILVSIAAAAIVEADALDKRDDAITAIGLGNADKADALEEESTASSIRSDWEEALAEINIETHGEDIENEYPYLFEALNAADLGDLDYSAGDGYMDNAAIDYDTLMGQLDDGDTQLNLNNWEAAYNKYSDCIYTVTVWATRFRDAELYYEESQSHYAYALQNKVWHFSTCPHCGEEIE